MTGTGSKLYQALNIPFKNSHLQLFSYFNRDDIYIFHREFCIYCIITCHKVKAMLQYNLSVCHNREQLDQPEEHTCIISLQLIRYKKMSEEMLLHNS